jgi:hypothetical protein
VTPLALALYEGRYDVVNPFLKSGKVEVNTEDFNGYDTLALAVRGKIPG